MVWVWLMRRVNTIETLFVVLTALALVPGSVFWLFPRTADAASLQLNPPAGSYGTGSVISVDVLVDSEGVTINAVSGEIHYRGDFLRAESVNRYDSVVDLWLQEPSVAADGSTVTFEGLIMNPGFGGSGKVITIHFRVLKPGETVVTFESGLVLANDGFGTNVVDRFGNARYSLLSEGPDSIAARTGTRLPSETTGQGMGLLPPVVISYTSNPRTLNDLVIRGVTYPGAEVHVFIKPKEGGEVRTYVTSTDAGGDFAYQYHAATNAHRLQSANVFPILEPLAQKGAYQFWLTAVQGNIETDSTQSFDVVVGGQRIVADAVGAVSALAVFLLVIGVVFLYPPHLLPRRWSLFNIKHHGR